MLGDELDDRKRVLFDVLLLLPLRLSDSLLLSSAALLILSTSLH